MRHSYTKRLSGKLLVGWVQPTNSPEKVVGFTHPTIVKQAFSDSLSEQEGIDRCRRGFPLFRLEFLPRPPLPHDLQVDIARRQVYTIPSLATDRRPNAEGNHPGMATSDIVIRGAREHNLRDVSLTLPRGRLICLTGVSGSGKSSLAFD